MTALLCQRVFLCVTFVGLEPILLPSVVFQYLALRVENRSFAAALGTSRHRLPPHYSKFEEDGNGLSSPGQPAGSVPASYRHFGRL